MTEENSNLSDDGVIAFAAIVGQILLETCNSDLLLQSGDSVENVRSRLKALAVYAVDYHSEPPLSEDGKKSLVTLQVTVDQILEIGQEPLIPIRPA